MTSLVGGAKPTTAPIDELFSKTDPSVDGDECLHDCDSCSVKYPRGFKIDEEDVLYGQVKGWATHLIVGTGKTDWVRDVTDEGGSVMEAVGKANSPENGVSCLRYGRAYTYGPARLLAGFRTGTSRLMMRCG